MKVHFKIFSIPFLFGICLRNYSEIDGNQVFNFYWIDLIQAIKRYIAKKKKHANKFYTRYEPQFSGQDNSQRAFSRANSGTIFQAFQLLNPKCSPVLALFYADASFTGQHMTHHPTYSMWNHIFRNHFHHYSYCTYCN